MFLTQSLHRALQQTPDLPMTICGGRVRTVREVADRVARLAGGLRSLGVAKGDRVAILALNSDRHHETFLATWWAGAVVNPVNIRWSPQEIAYSLRDSGSEVLLVDAAFTRLVPQLRELCPRLRTVVHCGDGPAPDTTHCYEDLIASSAPAADLRADGDSLAALLYTGGTTGFPKGVMIGARGLLTSAYGAQMVNRVAQAGGVTLVSAPMFHIAAVAGWLAQNLLGGTLVFLPAFEPAAVLEAVQRHRVTTMGLVPTMLQQVVEHPDVGRYDLDSVRSVGYGASPISTAVLEQAMKAFPHSGFVQGYGMTESAMITVLGREEHAAGGPRLRSAGRATPHCEVRIAGPDGEELPRGETGEVLMRGDSVMLGYWNKPEETAEALRGGWLHTGDAARMDEDGYVYVVDRLKDVIVTGGENVYSGEVEKALATHPAVASCAVIGVPDPRWGERVHAVIVLKPGASATAGEIRTHAKTLIAGYKAPGTVEFTDALPLSAAGKVLKRRLRDTSSESAESADRS
ncbi:long-chain-fatty-acid--CoA ligase [Streptomyces sp. NBC_01306]|uniref:long-chain-fatty-acid--CoA ligase n=1 Tax=Streptomyces sp. NBC_01306 TaxID=2903819 RepID=UPI00225BE4F9|nr:long-chain-fatty-acid--CoA ligase [Streptomyces sp. NBC_01306]MCX4728826.1 long-chain-fatty-acid--CoA ligase [Streptomyces sp. NBC_01306]